MKKTSLLLSFLVAGALSVSAQDMGGRIKGVSTVGAKGITVSVGEIMKNPEIRAPYSRIFEHMRETQAEEALERISGADVANPYALPGNRYPLTPDKGLGTGDEVRLFSPQTIGTTFTSDQSGAIFPPDTTGAVGPTQVMSTTNNRVKVFSKTGTVALNVTLDSFFNSVRNGSGTSDPRVTFDRITNRWFVLAINVSSPNRILLAVSNGPTITATTNFTFFFVQVAGGFCDYESMGVDNNGVYIGENTFNTALTAFLGTTLTVIQKSSVLGAGPIFSTRFSIGGTGTANSLAPRGVDNDDPSATEGYVVSTCVSTQSRVNFRKIFNANTTTPTVSASDTVINCPTTASPITPPMNGSVSPDTLGNRIFHVQMHLNRKTGARTIHLAYNTRCDVNGNGGAGDRDGIRWLQINPNVGGTATLLQAGTSWDPAATGFLYYWMGSCAMSGQGHLAISNNACNSATFAQIRAAGRLHGDGAGLTQPSSLAFQSTTGYNPGLSRWGDYSAVALDPADDQTMWAFQEFAATTTQWGTKVIKLIAPPPSPVNSVTPNTLSPGQTTNLTINGNLVAGSEYFDTDASYPNRLVCAFDSDITVNSVTFTHSNVQQIVLNVTVAGGAAAGPRNLTITNPDGQAVTANGAVTISGGPSTETLAPTSEQIILGTTGGGGNLASWAADDSNARTICKFFVPFPTSPFIRCNLNFTTTKTAPTAVNFNVKIASKTGGTQTMTLYVQDKTNSNFVATSVVGATLNIGQTYSGAASGTLSNYVGGGGAMTGQIEVSAVGFQSVAFPCIGFEFGQMVVTG
ncbi:MAG: hypothetical protein JNM34_03400 [Chthonomonadaceae bacterium]|nr:hypothetical protein [Chthonomonadaceae bacterium]